MMRRVITVRTCPIINFMRFMTGQGAGTCLSDITDETVHRRAHPAPPFLPVHNPGWE